MELDGATKVKKKSLQKPLVAPKSKDSTNSAVSKIGAKSNHSKGAIVREALTVDTSKASIEGRVSPCPAKSPFIADMLEKFEKVCVSSLSKDGVLINSSGSKYNRILSSSDSSAEQQIDSNSNNSVSPVDCNITLVADSSPMCVHKEGTDISLNRSHIPGANAASCRSPVIHSTAGPVLSSPRGSAYEETACVDDSTGTLLSSRRYQTSHRGFRKNTQKSEISQKDFRPHLDERVDELDMVVNIGFGTSIESSIDDEIIRNHEEDDELWEDEDDDCSSATLMTTKVKSMSSCERRVVRKKTSRKKSQKTLMPRKSLTLKRMDTVHYENNCVKDQITDSSVSKLSHDHLPESTSNVNDLQSDKILNENSSEHSSCINNDELVDTHVLNTQHVDVSHSGQLPPKPLPRTTIKKTQSFIKSKVLLAAVPAPPPRGASMSHSKLPDTQVVVPVPDSNPAALTHRPPPPLPKKLSSSTTSVVKSESSRRPPPPVPSTAQRGGNPPLPPALPPRGTRQVKPQLKSSRSRIQLDQLVASPGVSKSERTTVPLSSSSSLSVADLKTGLVQRRGSSLSLQVPLSCVKGDAAGLSPSRSEGYLRSSNPDNDYLPMGDKKPRSHQCTRKHGGTAIGSQYVVSDRCQSEERTLAPDAIPNLTISSRPLREWNNIDRLESVIPANAEDPDSATSDYSSVYASRSSLYDDEPLYQIYHQGAVVRDVIVHDAGEELECHYESSTEYLEHIKSCVSDILKRGSLSRTLSSASSQQTPPTSSSQRGLSSLESASKDCASFKKLWCEMPKVRESGVLNHMTMDERRLQESIFEVISSEASYLKSMNLLVGHFMATFSQDLEKNRDCIISSQDFRWLFSNCKAVREASVKTLEGLEALWMNGCVLNAVDVCERLAEVARQQYTVYIHYCKNAVYQERKFHELIEKNAEFAYTVQRLESVVDCRSLPLSSFLTLPMQRITRLPLLLQAMRSRLSPEGASSPQVLRCLAILQKIVKQCNDGAKKMTNLEQMCQINEELDFRLTKKIAVISESRYFVKKGQLTHICKESTGLFKRSKKPLYFFLFNDLLIITKKKSEKQYEVIEHSPRLNVHAEIVRDENIAQVLPNGVPLGCKHLFFMVLMDRGAEYILSCNSLSERTRWVQGFTPPEPLEGEEKIYESWDCPQVQAVRQYVAQQPDELSLEESDVINVLHKVTDGWYEGERIRDGEKGWFPVSYSVEIQNAHVRARNMRQQYRLMAKTFDHSIQQTTV